MNASKIALFLQDLSGGGAERMMVNLAGGLAALGIPVDLVLVREEGPLLTRVPSSVRIVPLGTRRVLYSIPALARYLRRERPVAMLTTLVHVNLAALVARRLSGVSTRLIVREANYVSINRTKIDFAPVRLAYQLIPWVYPWADRIIAVSQGVTEDLLKCSGLPRDRVVVLPNPVVTPELTAKAAEPVDHAWLAEGQPPVVLGVGRLVPQKDFATLIHAFAVVHGRRRARLVILGEGPVRLALEHQVRDLGLEADVALPGFANNPYAWMVRASVFVLSSAWEGSPNVLVEAMACGTPVVATDCPSGSREILMDGKFGTLVPVGDVTAMAEAIFTTLDHPPGPGLARQRAEAFAVDRVVGQYLRVLLGEKPV